jgi:hypothetical protein
MACEVDVSIRTAGFRAWKCLVSRITFRPFAVVRYLLPSLSDSASSPIAVFSSAFFRLPIEVVRLDGREGFAANSLLGLKRRKSRHVLFMSFSTDSRETPTARRS